MMQGGFELSDLIVKNMDRGLGWFPVFCRLPAASGGKQRRRHARRFQLHAWLLANVMVLMRMVLSQLVPCRQDRASLSDDSAPVSEVTAVALGLLYSPLCIFFSGEEPLLSSSGSPTRSNVLDHIHIWERQGASLCKAQFLHKR